MLFTSFAFVFFFLLFYAIYLVLGRRLRLQNVLLLVASYVFYGSWDWRFLSLLALSTLVNFYIGRALGRSPGITPRGRLERTLLLSLSVVFNLALLGFFKYFNFFVDNFLDILGLFGFEPDVPTLKVILPLGVSFYTFKALSYTIDIYREKLEPASSLLDFAVFVAFFPQLVAGPIERAANLLPQIAKPRRLDTDQIYAGLYLVLWGYFKKVVVADNLARIADQVFNNYSQYQGLDILLGVLAFAFQIYGDFSGYSDIARGVSRLMGFESMVNFRLPYFALNPGDFWARWHISLSTWLRDYLYIPLGGNRKGAFNTYRNLALTMLLGGLWHGAAWNFVIWGAYHGAILILFRLFERRPVHQDPWGGEHPCPLVVAKMLLMFALTLLGWLFFRAANLAQIGYMLTHISFATSAESAAFASELFFFVLPLLVVQVFQYFRRDLLLLTRLPAPFRVALYSLMLAWIVVFGVRQSTEFIYSQF